ncbi:Calx-beta domain-containing protein [Thalassotalea psychrophila]|uniref:Calx-beta domain-containing protein n=1 Tax=Thalassotalea psychrophila TaxID=3065647 RepID=A0ABY9TYE4_9GAMM|nr:Calx-beta domain-containing protein [Colwelliaceae bacterium SQ149]
MKLIKLSGIALSVALATHSAQALDQTAQDDAGTIIDTSYPDSALVMSDDMGITLGTEIEAGEAEGSDFDLLDLAHEFFNEYVASGSSTLAFSVDDIDFEFTTHIEYKYGLLHLYGTNSNGNILRLIRGDENGWFGDVSNGTESFSIIDTYSLGGSAWFLHGYKIPNVGEILVNDKLPVPATKDGSTNVDVGYTTTPYMEFVYGNKSIRASILWFHYQSQDILDNSGVDYYLNPLFIERQDSRFLNDEDKQEVSNRQLLHGAEYMFGDALGAETLRDYIKDFGVDYVSAVTPAGGFTCGIRRNEYKLDDLGGPTFVYKEETDRAEIVYGTILGGMRHQCRNRHIARHFFFHNFAQVNRSYYENHPLLPANKRTDYGGKSDYAYGSKCNGQVTVMNLDFNQDSLPIPVLSSPNVTYKGQTCGDESNNNARAVTESLPSMANNGVKPEQSADVSFKSSVFLALEGTSHANVTLVRDGDLSESASVEVAFTSTDNEFSALENVDFKAKFVRAEFAPGESETSVDVRIIDNDQYRENADIQAELFFAKRLNMPASAKAQVIIQDNDSAKPGSFSFEANTLNVNENEQTASIKIIRSGDFEGGQSINYSFVDGSAKIGSHYNAENGQVYFAEGEVEQTIEVELLANDYQNVGVSQFQVMIETDVSGDIKTMDIVINDDELASGTIALATETIDVDYYASQATITLTRNDATTGEIQVHYKTVDGSAVAGTHFVESFGNVTFAAGETEKTIHIKKLNVTDATEQTQFTVVMASPQLSGAKIVTVNLMTEPERESDSDGGSLGWLALSALALTGLRRKIG